MLDILIINASYPDFENNRIITSNIGIRNGKIAYIGNEDISAEMIIDAKGLVASPGFIDIHMHEENVKLDCHEFSISKNMLEMGVTTVLGGNCGTNYQSVADFKEFIADRGGSPVNYAMLSGYNSARACVGLGFFDTASPDDISNIHNRIKEDIKEGAFGVSFGIEYHPAITTENIISAANACLDDDTYIVSAHYRSDASGALDSIKEMIYIADNIKAKFQISHLSSCAAMGQMEEALKLIDAGIKKNNRISFDTYPYNAFSTRLGSAVFDGDCLEKWNISYSDILLKGEPYDNVRCTKEIFDDARKNHPDLRAICFAMNEEEIKMALTDKNGMIGSDGGVLNGKGHPRSAGTFPRVLGKYVRQEKVISLIDALKKMTVLPAERIGLSDKGVIAPGKDADITLFNPDTIIDKADFSALEKPEGIEYVIVNGKVALAKGEVIDLHSGRFIGKK